MNPNEINVIDAIIEKSAFDMAQQWDTYFLEGLKRKGFEFDNPLDAQYFVKANCKAVEDHNGNRTYYVNDIPFFYFKPSNTMDVDKDFSKPDIVFTASIGEYSYL